MKKYICTVCGYVYDEARGIPEAGIAPGTTWEQLPEDWVCPLCGASKAEFKEDGANTAAPKPVVKMELPVGEKELTALELSAVCSNLARGCEKQYKAEQAALFTQLADYFKAASAPVSVGSMGQLLSLVEKDLSENFSTANSVAADTKDRGALRALVWSEKVTRILKSLLTRYEKRAERCFKTPVCMSARSAALSMWVTIPPSCARCARYPAGSLRELKGGRQHE